MVAIVIKTLYTYVILMLLRIIDVLTIKLSFKCENVLQVDKNGDHIVWRNLQCRIQV